jgi:nucleoside-diphosphate-sugar epimerase
MRVFVAGASGAIGKRLVVELLGRGHEVVAATTAEANRPGLEALGASSVVADLLDAVGIAAAVRRARPEAVINVASRFRHRPLRISQVEPANVLRILGTRNLLAAALGAGARRYVSESMVFVYGYGQHAEPVTEAQPPGTDPRRGLQRILDALAREEHQVAELSAQGRIEGVALRFGLFHGRHAPSTTEMLELVRRRALPLVGDGSAVHSWIDVDDAARAVVAALERAPSGSVYNVVDDEPVAQRDYLAELVRLTGAPPPRHVPLALMRAIASYGAVVLGQARLPVSNAKIKRELGWQPRFATYRQALAACFDEGASLSA